MLDATSDAILAWSADGSAFEIRDAEALQRDVLPKFFPPRLRRRPRWPPRTRRRLGDQRGNHTGAPRVVPAPALALPVPKGQGRARRARAAHGLRAPALYERRRRRGLVERHARGVAEIVAAVLTKAAAPGSAEAPTSPRVRPREANEESALTALFALSGVSSSGAGGGGDAAPVEPKRQKVDEPVRVVG